MTSLSMVLGKEAVVAYMVVLTFQGEIMKNYQRFISGMAMHSSVAST